MLSQKTKKLSWGPNSMAKGLMALQMVAGRDAQEPDWRLRQAQHCVRLLEPVPSSPGKPKPAVEPPAEEPGKGVLLRPGCPQFSTRATSTSHFATPEHLPRDLCISSEIRRAEDLLLGRRVSDSSQDGRLLPASKSLCELRGLHRTQESQTCSPIPSGSVVAESPPTKRVPWYISVIHEKDHRLLQLEEELRRLSALETQVRKKDEELLALKQERESLSKQLKGLLRTKGRPSEATLKLGQLSLMKAPERDQEPQLRTETQEESQALQAAKEPALDSIQKEEGLDGEPEGGRERELAQERGAMQEEDRKEEEEEGQEEEEQELMEEEEEVFRPPGYPLMEAFEEELLAQLEEYEQAILEFQHELELSRNRYSLTTGAITSLERQLNFQDLEMRRMNTENEALQKELRERKQQLRAMSDKFSSLREDKKHQELTDLTERDNLLLRQQMSELDSELTRRGLVITKLEAKVSELQEQVDLDHNHLQRQKRLWEDLQGRNEVIRQAEQQARVALESTQARLERLRNKILQAAFSVTGFKSSTEITDSDILEALQRIITERSDFHTQLKQKGVKVPPLQQSETTLPIKSKKTPSK
ncbi:coiled-coil domain-containing protein 27 isoform X2 [Ochotona princeps]|uniref:coiled-coil domain-containing protein 27 isoform X2 n=1 Tax=Ochotona princeps TaxID=9978 RepID=UPI0027150421|nr:coiled-coil domain-containing protein 27 isoform X2 [Ochotona princeps]